MDSDKAPRAEPEAHLEEVLEPARERSAWISQHALLERLAACPALSSPPATIGFLASAANRDLDLDRLTTILASDPELVERLIKLANSALFGRRRSTRNIRQVYTRMGLSGTVNMAIALSLVELYRAETERVLLWRRHWLRSLAAAIAAHTLACEVSPDQAATAFLAALAQDIGMIVLARAAPELYEAVDPRLLLDRDWAGEAELDWYRAHHADISAWLLEHWGFPATIQRAVALAPRVGRDKSKVARQKDVLTRCVALSGAVADTWVGLGSDTARSSQRATTLGRKLFGLKPAQIGPLLTSVCALMPDISVVFGLAESEQVSKTERLRSTLLPIRTLEAINRQAELESSKMARSESADCLLSMEFDRALRHGWPLSVARIEIDPGEEVLPSSDTLDSAHATIVHTMRPSDLVAYQGDDGFIVAMPGTEAMGARAFARRLVSAFESSGGKSTRCAVGVAALESKRCHPTVEHLLEAAASAAKLARIQGWNQHVFAEPPVEAPAKDDCPQERPEMRLRS